MQEMNLLSISKVRNGANKGLQWGEFIKRYKKESTPTSVIACSFQAYKPKVVDQKTFAAVYSTIMHVKAFTAAM